MSSTSAKPSILDHFVGTTVLLVSNETDMGTNGMMKATLIGHVMTCRNASCPVALFEGPAGDRFMFGGHILPYDQRMWDFLAPMTVMDRFRFLLNQFNFKSDLHYALEQLRPVVPPPTTKIRWWSKILG